MEPDLTPESAHRPGLNPVQVIAAGLVLPWIIIPLLAAFEIGLDFPQRTLFTGLCSLAGFFGSYLFGFKENAAEAADTRQFYADMHRPVDFGAEVGESNDRAQLDIMGRLSFAVAGIIWLLLLIPNPAGDRLVIFCMGAAVFLLPFHIH